MWPLLLTLIGCPGEKGGESGETGEELDVLAALASTPGVIDPFEAESKTEGTRFYVFGFEQPVDHGDPAGATFTQYVALIHRDVDAPVVLDTRGYANNYSGTDNELSWLLGANRVNVEHRYFNDSVPEDPDWDYMRADQEADDLHAVVTALKGIYARPWISTGASKGGETALYYRAAWPDDVDGTVAYVAPVLMGYPDDVFGPFFEEVGDADCRQRLLDLQRALLAGEDTLIPAMETAATGGETWSWVGSTWAFETSTAELAWSFWQYDGDCSALPSPDAPAGDLLAWFMDWVGSPSGYDDLAMAYYSPFYFQSAAELGYPTLPVDGVQDLLHVDPDDLTALVPTPSLPTYDGTWVQDAARAVSEEGSRILLIYGEQDPWSVRALSLDGATDSYVYTAPGGNHGSQIADLDAEDQAAALDAISRWSGLDLSVESRRGPPPEAEAAEGVGRTAPVAGVRR